MRKFISVKQLSVETGLEEKFVYRLVTGRKIPFYKLGKRIFFRREEIEKWLEDLQDCGVVESLRRMKS